MTILYSDSVLPEGRHKGKLVSEVSAVCLKNFQRTSGKYALSDEVMRALNQKTMSDTRSLGTDVGAVN